MFNLLTTEFEFKFDSKALNSICFLTKLFHKRFVILEHNTHSITMTVFYSISELKSLLQITILMKETIKSDPLILMIAFEYVLLIPYNIWIVNEFFTIEMGDFLAIIFLATVA